MQQNLALKLNALEKTKTKTAKNNKSNFYYDFVKEKNGLDSFNNKQCLTDVLNYMAERISS